MTTSERRLKAALGAILRAADRAAEDQTSVAMFRLRDAATQARMVYETEGNVRHWRDLPTERRGPIGTHVENDCGGESWEVRKGGRWVLWCSRCGYIPRRWKVRGFVLKE